MCPSFVSSHAGSPASSVPSRNGHKSRTRARAPPSPSTRRTLGNMSWRTTWVPTRPTRMVGAESSKTDAIHCIRAWQLHCLAHGHICQYFLHDGGSFELSAEMEEELALLGMKGIATPPKIAAGTIERLIQVLKISMEARLIQVPSWSSENWLDAVLLPLCCAE